MTQTLPTREEEPAKDVDLSVNVRSAYASLSINDEAQNPL